jgi:hypothetical protein
MKTILKAFSLLISLPYRISVFVLAIVWGVISWPFRKALGIFKKEEGPYELVPAQEEKERYETYIPTIEEEVAEWYCAKVGNRETRFPVRNIIEILADLLEEGHIRDAAPLLPHRGGAYHCTRPKEWDNGKAAKATILTESADPTRIRNNGQPTMVKNNWPKRLSEARRQRSKGNRKPQTDETT